MEKQIQGWDQISEFLGMSKGWCLLHRNDLFKAGVVKHKLIGRPPRRRKIVYTWPSLLMLWDDEYRRQHPIKGDFVREEGD